MSLDVYLETKNRQINVDHAAYTAIYTRKNGKRVEISRDEWDELYPDKEPVTFQEPVSDYVYHNNITHNLTEMAEEAGIYKHLWRPEEIDITKASELIVPLEEGLHKLLNDPKKYKKYNPENGWGDYKSLVSFIEDYIRACKTYPDAIIKTWR